MAFTVSKFFKRYDLTKKQKCQVGNRIKDRFYNDYRANPPKIKEGSLMVNGYPDSFFKAAKRVFERYVKQLGLQAKKRVKK